MMPYANLTGDVEYMRGVPNPIDPIKVAEAELEATRWVRHKLRVLGLAQLNAWEDPEIAPRELNRAALWWATADYISKEAFKVREADAHERQETPDLLKTWANRELDGVLSTRQVTLHNGETVSVGSAVGGGGIFVGIEH